MNEQDMRDSLAAEGIDTSGLDYAAVAQLYAETFGSNPQDDEPLVPLALLKEQLGVEHDQHNERILGYLEAAIGWLDGPTGYLWRSVVPTDRIATFDSLGPKLKLPLPPVLTVQVVETLQGDTWVPQDPALWELEKDTVTLRPGRAWAGYGYSRVRYRAGYENIGTAQKGDPARIRTALMLKVQSLYERPERDVYAGAAEAVLSGLRLAA